MELVICDLWRKACGEISVLDHNFLCHKRMMSIVESKYNDEK